MKKIEWYKPSIGTPMVTFGRYGIVFNKAAIEELDTPPYIQIGFAPEEYMIAIKPVKKLENNAVEFANKIRDNSVRINKKDIIRFLFRSLNNGSKKTKKIPAYWSEESEMLLANLNQMIGDEEA